MCCRWGWYICEYVCISFFICICVSVCICICNVLVFVDKFVLILVYFFVFVFASVSVHGGLQANAIWAEGWHTLKWDYHSRWELLLPPNSLISLWNLFEMKLRLVSLSSTRSSHARIRFCLWITVGDIKLPDFMEQSLVGIQSCDPNQTISKANKIHQKYHAFMSLKIYVALKRNWLCDSNGLVLLLTTIDN